MGVICIPETVLWIFLNRWRLLRLPTVMTETDGEVVHRVKHYSIYIVLGSLKQGPELELACHNYLYGSLVNLTVLTGVPVWVIRDLSIEHQFLTSSLSTSFRDRYTPFT